MGGPYCRISHVRAALVRGIAVGVALLAPGVAHAGRTQFGWLFGTEVMPERGAEVQTFITEENGVKPTNYHDTVWGFEALIGVTDQLEIAFPVTFLWQKADATPASTAFREYGVE